MPKRIERRGKDSYRFTVSGGIGVGGKQILYRDTVTIPDELVEKDESILEREYGRFAEKVTAGKIASGKIMTLRAFYAYWKEHKKHEKSTVEYNDSLFVRWNQLLGHKKINKIQPKHILETISLLYKMDKKDPNEERKIKKALRDAAKYPDRQIEIPKRKEPEKLSADMVKKHFVLIKTLFNDAKQWQMATINPCDFVETPKAVRKAKKIPSMEQATELLALLDGESLKHKLFCLLTFTGGLRREELFGLDLFDDIDFTNNSAVVRTGSVYIRGQGVQTKGTKTDTERIVSFPVEVMSLLAEYKAEWLEHREKMLAMEPPNWGGSTRLFTTRDGHNAHPHSFNTWLRRFIKRKNIEGISPHIFRHMNATYLLHKGADLATVSGKLGHAQKSTTMNIYSHMLSSAEKGTAAIMSEFLKKPDEKQAETPD